MYSQALRDYLKAATLDEWHQVVWNWTWDYDLRVLEWMADQKQCDLGTARMIYWVVYDRIEALWDKDKLIKDLAEYDQKKYALMQRIEKMVETDFYENMKISFDPQKDRHCDSCEPWGDVYKGNYKYHSIPEFMFQATIGKKLIKEEWPAGLPDEVVDIVVKKEQENELSKKSDQSATTKLFKHPVSSGPKYWVYQTHIFTYGVQYVRAKLITPDRYEDNKFYYGKGKDEVWIKSSQQYEPYSVNLKLTYQVNPKHRCPDNYYASHGFTLFSEKLIQLMEEFGVRFEKFPVKMVDKSGVELKDLKYFVFHSFEKVLPAMDEKKSQWKNRDQGVSSLVLDLGNFEHRPVFLCNHLYVQLMRDDLKQ